MSSRHLSAILAALGALTTAALSTPTSTARQPDTLLLVGDYASMWSALLGLLTVVLGAALCASLLPRWRAGLPPGPRERVLAGAALGLWVASIAVVAPILGLWLCWLAALSHGVARASFEVAWRVPRIRRWLVRRTVGQDRSVPPSPDA